ncbi:hypothetical protein GCM10010315_37060 [Streptomyces luteosporeus]|uniref:Uncharacterized protein n=1 Tax=Streptomyces luteosporeus TaxID=173856 RepID=A0ABP6G8Y6_9ACTN
MDFPIRLMGGEANGGRTAPAGNSKVSPERRRGPPGPSDFHPFGHEPVAARAIRGTGPGT